jgi:hypothetical protein
MGCQWMMLPIDSNDEGHREIHHSRIYRMMRAGRLMAASSESFRAR